MNRIHSTFILKVFLYYILVLFPWLVFAKAQTAKGPVKFVLSASGGISLGSYQAGQLYYQSLFLKVNNEMATPAIITGASAGSINSFLTILDKCQPGQQLPNESYFWKTWQNIGFHKLLPNPKEGDASSLFSTRALEETSSELHEIWNKGFETGCEVTFGVPVTLKVPDSFLLGNGLSVHRQSVPLILKITGRGIGKTPKIENYLVVDGPMLQARLFLNGEDEHDFSALKSVLLASSAFPMAFPPQKIRVCIKSGRCIFESSEIREFIDGGIYENQPLNLGFLISTKFLDHLSAPQFFRHVDADGKVYPSEQSTVDTSSSFLQNGLDNFEKFISTSRTKELFTLLIRNPKISSKISNSVSYYPRASEPWGAFFGFFDEGFREFDFLLGMYESRRDFMETLPKMKQAFNNREIHIPDDSLTSDARSRASWLHFRCLASYLENKINSEVGCHGEELKNLKLLAQISLWRLYYLCHQPGIESDKWAACSALGHFNNQVPFVDKAFYGDDVLPRISENDGIYLMRLLQRFDYSFDKNEFETKESPDKQLRKKLKLVVDRLAEKQPLGEKSLVKRSSKVVLDYYSYQSPDNSLYVQFGELSTMGLQTNYLLSDIAASWVKADMGLDMFRISDWSSRNDSEATLTPFAGVVFDIDYFNSPEWQYQIGVAYGHSFARNQEECLQVSRVKSRLICDGSLSRWSLSISYRDLIRVGWTGRLSLSDDTKNHFDSQFAVGFQYEF